MRDLIASLFKGSEHYDLYQGVIETVEGIIREFPEDAWKRKMIGDEALDKAVQRTLYDAGLMGLGVDEQYGGMGGGLLQRVNRDTLRFAMKANGRQDTDGTWVGVNKDPRTDPGKASKRYRQAVVLEEGVPVAVPLKKLGDRTNLLEPVWRNGALLKDWSFAEIRQRAWE